MSGELTAHRDINRKTYRGVKNEQGGYLPMISIASAMLTLLRDSITQAVSPIDIGSRLELFVDDYLIDEIAGATQRLHQPQPQNVCLCS